MGWGLCAKAVLEEASWALVRSRGAGRDDVVSLKPLKSCGSSAAGAVADNDQPT
jgi:hypothetical protein